MRLLLFGDECAAGAIGRCGVRAMQEIAWGSFLWDLSNYFLFFLPYGIIATLPVQSINGEMRGRIALQGIIVTAVFTGVTIFVWRNGIRHYNSASS